MAVDRALQEHVLPVPGVVEVLNSLTIPYCVASNGRPAKLALTLGVSGLAKYFAGRMFTATEVAHGKPAPDLFLLAATRMGVTPARCVVVEDSTNGVAAGRAAGMRVLGYSGAGNPDALTDADEIFSRMADLPGLLCHSGR